MKVNKFQHFAEEGDVRYAELSFHPTKFFEKCKGSVNFACVKVCRIDRANFKVHKNLMGKDIKSLCIARPYAPISSFQQRFAMSEF